jgi:hypothetical protein
MLSSIRRFSDLCSVLGKDPVRPLSNVYTIINEDDAAGATTDRWKAS